MASTEFKKREKEVESQSFQIQLNYYNILQVGAKATT